MNTKENNYSLLREFNLEQAKAGETILYVHYRTPEAYVEVIYRGCTKSQEQVYVEYENGNGRVIPCTELKMKPLCWIDGKPVYKGDKLWYKSKPNNTYYQQESWSIIGDCMFDKNSCGFVDVSLLSWDKPLEPHVHQELIDAYNKGAEIQYWSCLTEYGYQWKDVKNPCWSVTDKYRIKPKELKKKSGWINLWKPSSNRHLRCLTVDNTVCSTKDSALIFASLYPDEYITTIEIHWEE